MSMGTAFASGLDMAMMYRRRMAQMGQGLRPRGRGYGSTRGITPVGSSLQERHLRDPNVETPEDRQDRQLKEERDFQREQKALDRGIERKKNTDDYIAGIRDNRLKQQEAGIKERETIIAEKDQALRGRQQGVAEAQDNRAGEAHSADMEKHNYAMDLLKRVDDHKGMMRAYFTNDLNGVMGWFIRNGPKAADGSQRIPIFEQGNRPGMFNVTWPGAPEAEAFDRDTLGQVLMRLSPKYEIPISKKSSGEISQKDQVKLRMEHAKNIAANTPMDLNKPNPYVQAYSSLAPKEVNYVPGQKTGSGGPPVEGAQLAPDGNWYTPRPDGGWSLVTKKNKDDEDEKKKYGSTSSGGNAGGGGGE